MLTKQLQPIPSNLKILCYACENTLATHIRCYRFKESATEIGLCPACITLDAKRLLDKEVGGHGVAENPSVLTKLQTRISFWPIPIVV
ncbi:MAG: hypothetical protein GY874_01965 [Desulfobacteraceae bacterium]|nr:hypothetical protein [Desulfobacteraceae bacterium]